LIQILCINALRPADAALCAAKAGRVNPPPGSPDAAMASSARRTPPPGFTKIGNRRLLRFTAR